MIKNKNEWFRDACHLSWCPEYKQEIIKLLSDELKKIEESKLKNKIAKVTAIMGLVEHKKPKKSKQNLFKNNVLQEDVTLDNVNEFSKLNAKKRISISHLINSDASSIRSIKKSENEKHLDAKEGLNLEAPLNEKEVMHSQNSEKVKKISVKKIKLDPKFMNNSVGANVRSENASPMAIKKSDLNAARSQFYS